MASTTGKKHWAVRAIRAIAIVEVAYLIVFNLALQLPLTQSLINAIKPDKFHVSWENAWTWYPFRAHAVGISANGQSRSQQWQLDAPSASASIALLPLLLKRVWLSDVAVTDASYKQRPRLKPDRDYSEFMPFFPAIGDREITEAVTSPRKKKRPWRLAIDNISLSGKHRYWIMQFSGAAEGTLSADLTFETAGGPLSIANGLLDIKLDTLHVNGDHEVFKQGIIKGELGFAPFVPRDNKGIKLLQFLIANADIDLDVNSLAFINLFTRDFKQMTIDGSGHVAGHVRLERGQFLPGTDIAIDARELQVNILGHSIEGEGTASISSHPETAKLLNLGVQYRGLEVSQAGEKRPLLVGDQLELGITGSSSLFPDPSKLDERRNLRFVVDRLLAPDLSLFQYYLPEKWPFKLYGGEGTLRGAVSLSSNAMDIDVSLGSEEADLGIRQYRFRTNLDAALKLANASASTENTSIAGSYIKLSDAGLSKDTDQQTKPWNASLAILDGNFGALQDDARQNTDNLVDILSLLSDVDGKELLGNLRGFVEFESKISSLDWIGVLLNDAHGTAVTGSGEVTGVIHLADGIVAPGTNIEVLSGELTANFLDYSSHGSGRIGMRVDQGDTGRDLSANIELNRANLKRKNEPEATIENVNLDLTAIIEDLSRDKDDNRVSVSFKLLSADVTDMSIFSSYLPPDSPFQFTNGSASLVADITLENQTAGGWVTLDSDDLELTIDGQSVSADLTAKINLMSGVPAEMVFEISGSEIQLTNMRVIGEHENFDQDNWSATLSLVHGETTWKKPLQLEAEATISILDSKPVVAMFNNQREKPDWLLEMLTVQDIQGTAKLSIANEQLVVPLAHAISDKIEVGAKGRISKQANDGIVYARYKKLDAVIKISDGRKNLDLIRAREKYDGYHAARKNQVEK